MMYGADSGDPVSHAFFHLSDFDSVILSPLTADSGEIP